MTRDEEYKLINITLRSEDIFSAKEWAIRNLSPDKYPVAVKTILGIAKLARII